MPIHGVLKFPSKNIPAKEIDVVGFVTCPCGIGNIGELMVVYVDEDKKLRTEFAKYFTAD